MALTEAEKRALLRERRAAKMAQSSARLNRITGEKPVETEPVEGLDEEPVQELKQVSAATKKNNRISQNFSDPPMQDIDSVAGEAEEQDFQKVLEKILGSSQHGHGDAELKDMFSMMQGMSSGAEESSNEPQDSTSEEALLAKAANDKYKALFMLVKLIFTGCLTLYFFTQGHRSSSYALPRGNPTQFIQIFTAFEVITTSVYALHLINTKEAHYNYNSKVLDYLGFVPAPLLSQKWKGRIKLGVKYLELLQLSLFDVSTVVVVYGALSWL